MKLPARRAGERIVVNKKVVPFSYWPTRVGPKGNATLEPAIFSFDPWALIRQAIEDQCPTPAARDEALALVAQANDFYESANDATRVAARPLSVYYCLMDLAKALCLTRGLQPTFDQAQHGLSEKLKGKNRELVDAFLRAFPSPSASGILQNFDELSKAIGNPGLTTPVDYDIPALLPQILPGHRLWTLGSGKKERFIAIQDIRPMREGNELWLNVYVLADDLVRVGVSHADFMTQADLASDFQQVACDERTRSGNRLLCFQQRQPLPATSKKHANSLQTLFDKVRRQLWCMVTTAPPYRRYYVYLRPASEANQVLPQLVSTYALAYYLGSITRYRPHHFASISAGPFGPRIQDFVTSQPTQFLYLMATEFLQREVAKPAIV